MSRLRIRRRGAIALAVAAVFSLSACGSGLDAPTNQIYQAGVGADHRGQVWALNAFFVAEQDGSATLSGSLLNKKSAEQELTDISVADNDGNELDVTKANVPEKLGVEHLQKLGTEDTPVITIDSGVTPGLSLNVTFSFSDSADIVMKTPVVKRNGSHVDVIDADQAKAAAKDDEDSGDDSGGGANDESDDNDE